MLPEYVRAVYRGPDGRIWYQLSGDSLGRSDSQLKGLLEAEYRQTTPQIAGASLALLESNGRAWFYNNDATVLWGYDGEHWIEHRAFPGARFLGRCPTAGELEDNLVNRAAGGKAFFRDLQGVHVFDGKNWSYRGIATRVPTQNGQIRYAVSPSGNYAVALPPKIENQRPNIAFLNLELWTLKEGQWQEAESPWADKPGSIGPFIITDSGVLWYIWYQGAYNVGGRLRWLSLAPPADASPSERVARLIAMLDDNAFEIRQQATDELVILEQDVGPQLEAARKVAKASAEVRTRIDGILRLRKARLASDDATIDAFGSTIGQCRVQRPKSVFQDAAGGRYVFAEAVSQGESEPRMGLAVVTADRKSRVYPLDNLDAGVLSLPINVPGPVLDSATKSLWISTPTFPGPVRRLDLVSGTADAGDPDRHFGVVQAFNDNGHLFIGGQPHFLASSRASIGLLRPEVADTRLSLTPRMEPLGWSEFIVGDDGVVWAMRKEQGLCQFDGREWKLVHTPKQNVTPRLGGTGGVLIALTNRKFGLWHPGGFEEADTLNELIKANRALIAKAFPPSYTPIQRQLRFCISTDTSGNIWVIENGKFSVLANDSWLDVAGALQRVGLTQGRIRYLSAVGDGSKIYISDLGLAHLQGRSFLARLVDGNIEFTPAPHATASGGSTLCLRTDDGALWIPCQDAEARGNITQVLSYRPAIVTHEGEKNDGPREGWPALIDRSGNVWLVEKKHTPTDGLMIWRDGRIVQRLKMPGKVIADNLFSDRPGSVFVWTSQGLHHLVVSEDDPETFTLKSTHVLRLPSPGHESAYSSLAGFMVGLRIGTQANLALFQLPAD